MCCGLLCASHAHPIFPVPDTKSNGFICCLPGARDRRLWVCRKRARENREHLYAALIIIGPSVVLVATVNNDPAGGRHATHHNNTPLTTQSPLVLCVSVSEPTTGETCAYNTHLCCFTGATMSQIESHWVVYVSCRVFLCPYLISILFPCTPRRVCTLVVYTHHTLRVCLMCVVHARTSHTTIDDAKHTRRAPDRQRVLRLYVRTSHFRVGRCV